ncbi:MAG: DinB family protein [Chloroflexi bacterium]|nr:DinB family protein [Chloroflexota bacterium]MDA1003052.1 DinB family protein [Chloroflexota bacterium]MQC28061.1 hypothetical protein [Chloroflexota bacterium]
MANPSSEFDRYREEILAALGGRDPLSVLTATLDEVRMLTTGVSAAVLGRAPAAGEWAPAQVLSHLSDNDMVWGTRVRMIVTDDRPLLVPYDQEVWTARFAHLDAGPTSALTRWVALREANLAVWRSLDETEWTRTGMHPERGEQTVREITALLAGHDIVHSEQIRRGIAAAG